MGESSDSYEHIDVAIIGGGISGICAGWQLLNGKGYRTTSFRIYEKSDGIGGTWNANRYPGAACDIPSHLYSYSFAPNPDWSRKYACQAEIQAYLERVVDTGGVRPYLRTHTQVVACSWGDKGKWRLCVQDVHTGQQTTLFARFVISAVGALCVPQYPRIPGLNTFQGQLMHTAQWDARIDLRGKNVAVVGTGASAAQLIPAIQPLVKQLYVVQRTPLWAWPRGDGAYPRWLQRAFRYIPLLMLCYRWYLYWWQEATYYLGFRPLLQWAVSLMSWLAARHRLAGLGGSGADPKLCEALTPRYPIGCKRVIVTDEYYPALAQRNVTLVPHALQEVTAHGLRVDTTTTQQEITGLDVIIFATGFDVAAMGTSVAMEGAGGFNLARAWHPSGPHGGPSAYLGVATHGAPNAFFCLGPNSILGHNSVMLMIECQIGYILQVMGAAVQRGASCSVGVREAAQAAFDAEMTAAMAADSGVVWANCDSWYNKDAKQRITTLWPWSVTEYLRRTRTPKWSDFEFDV